jgi:two-component system, NtrC family, sensor kinase
MSAMRVGLRPQLLIVVTLLLGLALVPLFWTATTISRYSLGRAEQRAALNMSRSTAHSLANGQLHQSLAAPIIGSTVVSIGSTSRSSSQPEQLTTLADLGERITSFGEPVPTGLLALAASDGFEVRSSSGHSIWSWARGNDGFAYVGVRIEPDAQAGRSLFGLLALYMGLLGIGLLLAIHLAVTFFMVRPLDALARAARRVAFGARELQLPRLPATELMSLGTSLRTMTEKLLSDERELRRHLDEIHEANQRLKQAQERLIRSERLASVGRLAAGLAHEVGNPITAMMGLEELLIAGGLSAEEQRDFLQRLQGETARIHRILRDLLDFARPIRDIDPQANEPGDVAVSLAEVLSLVRPQKAFQGVDIETQVPPQPRLVALSRPRLVQVLLNLLLNAADALGSMRSDSLRACSGSIRIQVENGTDMVTVIVSDNGPGLAESVRPHLFEPFVTTKDIGQGTGLGLAVCRGLVESVGGSIRCDTAYGEGARFTIELPVADGSAP